MTTRFILPVAVAAALALSACASPGPRGGGDRSDRGDRSERRQGGGDAVAGRKVALPMAVALTGLASGPDGRIMLGAVPAAAEQEFARFDADGSGTMSAIEHARWATTILGDSYARPTLRMMDSDLSGGIERDEFVDAYVETARRYDADSSGTLERSELMREVAQGRQAGRGGERGEAGGRSGGRSGGGQGRPPR